MADEKHAHEAEHEKKEEHAHEHHSEHNEHKEEHEHKESHEEHRHKEEPKENHKEPEKKHELAPSEKKDLKDSRIFVLVFTLAGTAMALLSSILKSGGISSWITGVIGIILLLGLSAGMGKLFKRKLKFYSASIFIYLLMWLVVWIFLYNV